MIDTTAAAEWYEGMFQPVETVDQLEQKFDNIDDRLFDFMNDNEIMDEVEAIETMADRELISAGERDACLSSIK